jgi:hypothetical protein
MIRRGIRKAMNYSDAFYSPPPIPSCQTCRHFMPNMVKNDDSEIEGYCRKNNYKLITDCRIDETICGKHGNHYQEAPTPFIIVLSIITGVFGAVVFQKLKQ